MHVTVWRPLALCYCHLFTFRLLQPEARPLLPQVRNVPKHKVPGWCT